MSLGFSSNYRSQWSRASLYIGVSLYRVIKECAECRGWLSISQIKCLRIEVDRFSNSLPTRASLASRSSGFSFTRCLSRLRLSEFSHFLCAAKNVSRTSSGAYLCMAPLQQYYPIIMAYGQVNKFRFTFKIKLVAGQQGCSST